MRKTAMILALVAAACGKSQKQENLPPENAGPAIDAQAAPAASARPTDLSQLANVGNLQVVKNDLKPNPDSMKMAYSGTVAFKGELQVTGSYRAHYEYPQVKEACFWVDPNDWSKVPRVTGDERPIWFCFTNKDEAIAKLGALGTNARATIVVDDYTTKVASANIWDTARLVRVVSKTGI